ncbi:related to Phosphatidylserine decarboxylase proenzyme 1, mitochondrial [Saccharomycodes ludwigii]|uniref:Phosphatidylserine decarboxylase proenzyme 1, mitochondrial n=1 Tax=Saccharomycodes ludwigii TaxID=36035 RepID=A0A376B8W5_9ASCO|nr:hypothetical protein SCDLUD_002958 [Saccharomycodes ludwigii]KAH3901463.1 hypothetical protein SCDLUD_002958 [Saccharomycodes ludwigii]SSD61102.1 related to Phosphatidylserine decarboxylase proenzyme 1, mitochondrial [Saccharomycodes ludwigii]
MSNKYYSPISTLIQSKSARFKNSSIHSYYRKFSTSSRTLSPLLEKYNFVEFYNSKNVYSSITYRYFHRDPITNNNNNNPGMLLTNKSKKAILKWIIIIVLSLFVASIILPENNKDIDEDDLHDGDKKLQYRHRIRIVANDWMFFLYSTLPLNAASRLWGQVNSLTLPEWFRPIGFKLYSYVFGANLNEMQDPDLTHYTNLSEFFYRNIKPETRPIAVESTIVCPSDGKILQLGEIDPVNGEIEQVKGLNYSLQEFLGTHSHPFMNKLVVEYDSHDKDDEKIFSFKFEEEGDKSISSSKDNNLSKPSSPAKNLKVLKELISNDVFPGSPQFTEDISNKQQNKLMFAVIYLAPGDYHHYHSPVDWVIKLRRHFPGELFSVAPYFQHNFPNLFVLNERVALLGQWKYGFFSMTPVGATNVGSIKLNFDRDLVTNDKQHIHNQLNTCYEANYKSSSKLLNGVPMLKGEEMGGFMLGSTVVLCFEVPNSFKYNVKVGDIVKVGQSLGDI